jgi:hypothetical protein
MTEVMNEPTSTEDFPTANAQALAYSDEEPETEVEEPEVEEPDEPQPEGRWGEAWGLAVVLMLGLAVVAALIVWGGHWVRQAEPTGPTSSVPAPVPTTTVTAAAPPPPPAVTVTVTPPPPPPPPTVKVTVTPKEAAPTVTAQPPGMLPDDTFLEYVNNHGMHVTDPGAAIAGAHQYCADARAGESDADSVRDVMRNNSTMTLDNAWTFVIAAHTAYCPELRR